MNDVRPPKIIHGPDDDNARAWGYFLAASVEEDGVPYGQSPVIIARKGNEFTLVHVCTIDVETEVNALADTCATKGIAPPPPVIAADDFAIVGEGHGAMLEPDDPAIVDPARLADLQHMRIVFATTSDPDVFVTAAHIEGSNDIRVRLHNGETPPWFVNAGICPALQRLRAAAAAWHPNPN